ncbi:hypothetical protein Q3G72_011028 [Acer saccharum]|nr:hypothetical protein Q3G72_011028 [Acer saccharum]
MESDMVWERFLPFDYSGIVSRSLTPFNFSSKKQLFQCLCNPLLIGGGKLSFNLEKSSGKKSYLLSARALSITWSNDPLYWCWVNMTKSRFSQVAVLRTTHWLEIEGKIKTGMLSSNTKYGAYLVIKIRHNAYGLDSEKAELSVQVGDGQAWTVLKQRQSLLWATPRKSGVALLLLRIARKKNNYVAADDLPYDQNIAFFCQQQ